MNDDRPHIFTAGYAIVFAAKFFSSTVFSLLNVSLVGYAVAQFGVGLASAGFAVGVFTLGSMIVRPIAGRFVNAMGPGRMLVAAFLLFLLATFACGLSSSLGFLIAVRAIQGVAFGAIYNTITVVVTSLLPPEDVGRGLGIFAISTTLSTAVGPFLGITLLQSFPPEALFGAATMCAAVSFLLGVVLLVRFNPTGEKVAESNTEKRGLLQSYFDKQAVIPGLFSLLVCLCYAGVTAFLNGCLTARGLGQYAAWYFMLYPVLLVVIRPIMGRYIDRGYGRILSTVSLALFAAGLLLLGLAGNVVVLLGSSVLIIFGYGGAFFCLQTVTVKRAGSARVGVAVATFGVLSDLGMAFGPIVMGLLQGWLDYGGMYIAAAGALGVATLLAHAAKEALSAGAQQ